VADVASITDPVYAYKSDNGFFSASFASTIGTDNAVLFTTNGYTFGWKPENVIYVDDAGNMDVVFGVNAASTAQVWKSRVSYVGTSQITTDIFDCNSNELKHEIRMVAPPRLPAGYIGTPAQMASGGVITYDATLQVFADGQVQTTDFEVTGDIGFKDADGNLIYKLPMITVEDANGQTTQGTYKVTFNADGTISFYGMVPWDFLQTAAYPVVIDPTVIVSSAYDTSGNGGRKIVRLSNNWIVTCGVGSSIIYFWVSKDNGQTWSQLCYENAWGGFNSGSYAALSSSGTNVYALIVAPNNGEVLFYSFDATTVTNAALTTYKTVDSGQSSMGSGCSLCIDSTGKLWAVWCSKNSTYANSFNIRVSSSTDGGTTWATPTQVTTDNVTSAANWSNPCIVIKSNNSPIIISVYNNGTSGNQVYALTYSGTTWSLKTIYTGNGYTQLYPCAAVDSNDVIHVVWCGQDATDPSYRNIRYSKSTDGGSTWSAMLKLTSGNLYHQQQPTIAISPNNDLYVFWHGIDTSVNTSWDNIRKIVNTGGTWGAIASVTSNTTNNAHYPQTLWSKFNMNSDDAIRYMWQDNQVASVKYDSITLNSPPNAPTLTAHANFDATVAQTLAWLFSDPDSGNTQSAYQLQLYDTTNLATPVIDTGKVGSTVSSYSLAANALSNGKSYQWHVQTWDQSGAQGPYSGYSTFSTSASPVATVTAPASGATITADNYTFTGGYTQAQGVTEQSFQFKVWDSTGTTVQQDSGTIIGTSNAKTFSGLANNTSYKIEFIVTSQSGVSASSGKIPFSVAYTPPATPTATTSNDATNSRVAVTFTNPTPSGSQPTVSSNTVFRRKTGDTAWTQLQTGAISPYYDYTCPVGSHDYGVTGVSSAGAISGYGTSTVSASFDGEWVIDESNPANNVTFLYNQRESDATVNQSYTPVQTFAKYPRIRKGQARYRTGNLTALKLDKDGDVNTQVDAIDNMCNSDNTYLLKSVNGRIYRVSLSQFKYTGKYGNSQADVSVVWTEVGDV
jgi:hypothetical protein